MILMDENLELEEIDKLSETEILEDFTYSKEVLDSVKAYLVEISCYKVYDREEILSLIKRYKEGEVELRDTIIQSNLKLVVYFVKKLRKFKNKEDFLDCIQEGNLGLLEALENFDISFGCAFSTYAYYKIRKCINENKRDKGNTIRLPAGLQEKLAKYRNFKEQYVQKYHCLPTEEECKKALSIEEETLKSILLAESIDGNIASLNQYVNPDDADELGDFVPSYELGYTNIENYLNDKILLVNLKNRLNPIEYYVLYFRYLNIPKLSLEAIGQDFFLSRERIRQIEIRALEKVEIEIRHIRKKPNLNYDVSEKDLIPLPFKDRVILFYLKRNLSSFDYHLLYHFIYLRKKVEEYFSKEDLREITKKIRNLKSYERLFTHEGAYKKIYAKIKDISRDEVFNEKVDTALLSYKDISDFMDVLTLDEVKVVLQGTYENLEASMRKTLDTYYKLGRKETSLFDIESAIGRVNLKICNYNQNELLKKDILYETLLKNKDKFSEEDFIALLKYFKEGKNSGENRIRNLGFYLHRLECIYYRIDEYFNYIIPKEDLLEIIHEEKNGFNETEILLLEERYKNGVSIQELALRYEQNYILMHDVLKTLYERVVLIYINKKSSKLSISDKDRYKKYLFDKRYSMTKEAREVTRLFLYDKLNYNVIKDKLGIDSVTRVSNIVTDTIRKMDMWEYGIDTEYIFNEEDIQKVCDQYNYSLQDREIVKNRFLENKNMDENVSDVQVSKGRVKQVIMQFIVHYNTYFSPKDVTKEDYRKEILMDLVDSVLTEEEKCALALELGISSSYNEQGKIYTVKEIGNIMNKKEKRIKQILDFSKYKLKCREGGLLRPVYGKYTKGEVKEFIQNPSIPLSDEEREILRYLKGIGCEAESDEKLSVHFHKTKSSINRRIRRAFLTIAKYNASEKEATMIYEKDVEPYIRFFPMYEQNILRDIYQFGYSRKQLTEKYNLSLSQVYELVQKIEKRLLYIIKCPLAQTFDFDYARSVLYKEDLPYHGDIESIIKIYTMFFGDNGKAPKTKSEVIQLFQLSETKVTRCIKYLMLAVLKYKDGIRKSNYLIYEEVEQYYLQNKESYSETKRTKFTGLLSRMEKEKKTFFQEMPEYNNFVTYEILKSRQKMPISIEQTKESALQMIQNKEYPLTDVDKENLLSYYKILPRELIPIEDKMRLYTYLDKYIDSYKNQLDKEMVKANSQVQKDIRKMIYAKEKLDKNLHDYRSIMYQVPMGTESNRVLLRSNLTELLFMYIRLKYRDIQVVNDSILMKMVYLLEKSIILSKDRNAYLETFRGKLTMDIIKNNSNLEEEVRYFWTHLIQNESYLIDFRRNYSTKELVRNTISFYSTDYERIRANIKNTNVYFKKEVPNSFFSVIDLGYEINTLTMDAIAQYMEHVLPNGIIRGYVKGEESMELFDNYLVKTLTLKKSNDRLVTIQRK